MSRMTYDYIPQETTMRYYVPKTLAADFDEFLKNDIPGAVESFTLVPDWFAQNEDAYVPKIIRGELYPETAKSRYINTDNNLNFRASVSSGIKKGDMLISGDGTVYVFDWEVAPQPNNAATRALRCNTQLRFTRFRPEQTDDLGYVTQEEGRDTIVESIPCNAYEYDGRPEYTAYSNTPGITPTSLIIITVQYNNQTARLKTDDEFIWGGVTYYVVDVNCVGVNELKGHGVLSVQAKKKPGGLQ